jgi:hypothetical protein
MKKILVTGGAGYIGSQIVFDLVDLGYKVVVADNLSTGHKKLINKKAIFYKVDVGNKVEMEKIFLKHRIDQVIHLAASLSVEESMKNPSKYYLNNVVNTKNLLNVEDKRLAKLAVQSKFLNVGKNVLKDMGPLGSAVSGAFNASKMNPWVLAADAAVAILEKGYENFKAFDKAAVDVRKNLGALPGQAKQLESLLKQVGIESMHLGATFDDVAKSCSDFIKTKPE